MSTGEAGKTREKAAVQLSVRRLRCLMVYAHGQFDLLVIRIASLRKAEFPIERERRAVFRGDLMSEDEPEVQNAVHRVAKFYRQATKKCEKKPTEKKDDQPSAPVPEQQPSLTEQLLKEAEAQEQPPASTPQNPPNEAE